MKEDELIEVPRWILETIDETLRLQYIIYEEKADTFQKRNVKESLWLVRKLLDDAEITGHERIEK